MDRKIALITGATSGIGLETARVLAQNNYNLILTGRRKDRLEQVKKEIESDCPAQVLILNFDIRDKAEVKNAYESLPSDWKQIDVLINNAGLAAGLAPVDSADMNDWEQMIDTNIKGLLYMSQTVSPGMIERKSGHIVNISSVARKEVYPNGSVYCGTKHAVAAISRTMRIELLPSGVKVSTVSPGAVDTEFSLVRFKGDRQRADKVYDGFTPLYAKDIADTIWFVLSRPSHVNIDDILVMPTAQGSARDFFRES
ncbi:MAG TPA: NAD(P)-dependent oxidoreductase [Marinilabiliales bacterium]|nr:NAD(P)-dependent oxidoreductase [Marinilabiliales bacterium]